MSLNAARSLPLDGDRSGHADLNTPGTIGRLTNFRIPANVQNGAMTLVIIGLLSLVVSMFVQRDVVWACVLMVSFLLISLGLSGVLMIALQYLTGAGWSIALRRISEALTSLLIPGLIGIAAVLIFGSSIYPWTHPPADGHESFTGFKGFWLDRTNWLIRAAIYAGLWLFFAFTLRWNSRQQDNDGRLSHSRMNVALSAMFVICFALTYWLASVDWLMSLEPHWFSTMFGVYNFSGLFTGGVACTIIIAVWLRDRGPLRGIVSDDHLHDLGKLLLAFTTFWAYIWFSEYMLIWYANIPEETEHFIIRTQGLWKPLFYLNVGLNWVIPFLALLPRAGKRSGSFLVKIALVVLLGRVLDMYMLIMPTVGEVGPLTGIASIGITLGAIGVFVLVVGKSLGNAALIPLKDPYLEESLHHHV